MKQNERNVKLNIDGMYEVGASIAKNDDGYMLVSVSNQPDSYYPIMEITKLLREDSEMLEKIFNSTQSDQAKDIYLNIAGHTEEKIVSELNEVLKGTSLEAFVTETSESYEATDESDELYDGLPMYEGGIRHVDTETELEDTYTGRYVHLASVREELLKTANLYSEMTICIIKQDNSDRARYVAVGQVKENKFSGLVYGYAGGGTYEQGFALNGKWLPCEDVHGEILDDDAGEALLDAAIDSGFIDRCAKLEEIFLTHDNAENYVVIDPEIFREEHLRVFGRMFEEFPSWGLTTLTSCDTSKEVYLESYNADTFLYEVFDVNGLLKETAEQHYINNPESTMHQLLEETIESFYDDEVYGAFMNADTEKKMREYTGRLLLAIEDEGLSLGDLDLKMCEICSNCNQVLLPDDEAYTNGKDGSVLCDACSIECDICEKYFVRADIERVGTTDLCDECRCVWGEEINDSNVENETENPKEEVLYGVFVFIGYRLLNVVSYADIDKAKDKAVERANAFQYTEHREGKEHTFIFTDYSELAGFNQCNDQGIKVYIEEIKRGD